MRGFAALSRAATACWTNPLRPPPVSDSALWRVTPVSCVTPKTVLNELLVVYGAVQFETFADWLQYVGGSPSPPSLLMAPVPLGLAKLAPPWFWTSNCAVVESTTAELAYAAFTIAMTLATV